MTIISAQDVRDFVISKFGIESWNLLCKAIIKSYIENTIMGGIQNSDIEEIENEDEEIF
jgi:hypothetical protein